jgi:hypothetical protein
MGGLHPGSCPPNWLQGKPRISKSFGYCAFKSLYSFSRPANCGVKPHLEAVLTTRTTLLERLERG